MEIFSSSSAIKTFILNKFVVFVLVLKKLKISNKNPNSAKINITFELEADGIDLYKVNIITQYHFESTSGN